MEKTKIFMVIGVNFPSAADSFKFVKFHLIEKNVATHKARKIN